MYKKFLAVIIAIFLLLVSQNIAFAHPIDNTDSYFYFEKEVDGYPVGENEIKMYSYINWFQAGLLVEKSKGIVESDVMELLKYQSIYNDYIKERIKVSNNGESCPLTIDESPITEDEISLSLGTRIMGTFKCPTKIENVKIENSLFVEDFEFESNFTSIFNGDTLLHGVTLDRNNQVNEFNAEDLKQNPLGDETRDNSANFSADQVTLNVPENLEVEAGANISEAGSSAGPKEKSYLSNLTDILFLKSNAVKDQSVPVLLGLVFLLGFLHTVEAGHSKSILASSMLHKKMDVKKGLAYASIFTVTHLADIIIVGLILLVADNYFNLLQNFSMVEKVAGYALFGMSIYLLLKSLQEFLRNRVLKAKNLEVHDHPHDHDHAHEHNIAHEHTHDLDPNVSFKDQLILGVLAGLAPCVFGWSIFMLILSTNKIWVLVPSILSFGLGIFTALAILVFLITHLKTRAYSKFEKLAEFSPIISAGFLLVYSILLIT